VHTWQRAFELTDRFAELQRDVPAGQYYHAVVNYQGSGAGLLDGGSDETSLRSVTKAAADDSAPSRQLMAIAEILAFRPTSLHPAVQLRCELSAPEGEGELHHTEMAGAGLLLRSVTSPEVHTGFCEEGLNSVGADLSVTEVGAGANATVAPLSPLGPPATAVPWLWSQGDDGSAGDAVNADLWRLLTGKVLAVLAQKPGCSLGTLHAAVEVLSRAQTERLVQELVATGYVLRRMPKVATRRSGPFPSSAPHFATGAAYFAGRLHFT
jgi:hypothetical protein